MAHPCPAVTPIITEDSNPLSETEHATFPPHLYRPKRPLREKTKRAYGRSKRQTCFTNHLSRLEPSVRLCNPAVSWPPTPPSLPSSNHRHRSVNTTPTPKDSKFLSGSAIQPVPNQAKDLTPPPPPFLSNYKHSRM